MGELTTTQLPDADARRARIRKLCQDHAWRFHAVTPGCEYRYVIEAYVPDATPADWAHAKCYIDSTPGLFTSWPQLQPGQVRERDEANRDRLSNEARAAFNQGNYALALAMIDDAEWWAPLLNADRIREVIRGQMAGAA